MWSVVDYDGNVKPDRWDTEQEALDRGLCGKYLLSGADVVEVCEPEQ